jgi:hypothetical protein
MDRAKLRLEPHTGLTEPTTPELPTLTPGVTRLVCEGRAVGPLDSLVLDHLLGTSGQAVWVDTGGHATTQSLARLAPTLSLLERLRVARAFTPYQHHTLLRRATDACPHDAGLVVVPWVDAAYREGGCSDREAGRLLEAGLDRLATLAAERELAVLVTTQTIDGLSASIAERADTTLSCRTTRFGPRFVGDGFETLVYESGGAVQTTLAFWARVLERRQLVHAAGGGTVAGVA